jgi:hypothetical protein
MVSPFGLDLRLIHVYDLVDAVSETPRNSAYEVPSPAALTVGGPWLSLELLSFPTRWIFVS